MTPKADADLEIDPDPQLEREADQAAEAALSDGPMIINRMGADVHIQRSSLADHIPAAGGRERYNEPSESIVDEATAEADEFSIDEQSVAERVIDGLKEGGLRSVLAGTIAGGAALTSGGAPAIAAGAAAASALATTTAANAAFGTGKSVSEEVVTEMSGAVAKSEAFAEQAAENEQLAESLASNESLLSKLASKLNGLIGNGSEKTDF